jgi:MFS transporter, AAHS family, 4-hydroxybenzoate transporter
MIGLVYSFGAAATALIGYSGQSGTLLLGASFVAGFLSIGAQMCTVALCASVYETKIRATGVGWTVGVGRIGAVAGLMLGGTLSLGILRRSRVGVAGCSAGRLHIGVDSAESSRSRGDSVLTPNGCFDELRS